jgi:L,D-transpeptidase-like protein/putative peptidoglycan binding protein
MHAGGLRRAARDAEYDLAVKEAICSSAAVRAAVFLGAIVAALVAAPAAAAAPAVTKLTLSGPHGAPGGKATLTTTLTSGGKAISGKAIALFAEEPAPLATATTDKKGRAAFEVTVTAPTSFHAAFTPAPQDAAAYAPATSNTHVVAPAIAVKLSALTYLHAGHKPVGVPRERVRIRGSIATFTAGQQIQIAVFKKTKRVKLKAAAVKPSGGKGRFAFSFKPGGHGVYRVQASVPGGSATKRIYVVRPRARPGSHGTAVRALQNRLKALGYLTPVSGSFNSSTARAVLAFRKVNGYSRTTYAGRAVFRRLARGGGAYRMRHPKAGKHVEFDWSRQVLVLARGARPVKVLHASSGKPTTPTVFGKFRFYRKSPGYNSHGMFYSSYFIGGYAVHGYAGVPNYPASHGCIRIPIPSAIAIYRWIKLGNPIYVYR